MSSHNEAPFTRQKGPIVRRPPMTKRLKDICSKEASDLWNHIREEKPLLPFLLPLILFAWILERWLVPFSNWVPLFVAVWTTIQYGRYQRQLLAEDLNNKWKRHIRNTSPTTPLEPCEWLNKILSIVWPNFLEPKLSNRFLKIMLRRLKDRKPRFIESIEVQEFSLGSSPPTIGLQRTYWSTSNNQPVLHMGFEWDTNEMSVLLAAKTSKPFRGMARIVIHGIHLKGDLQFIPILDGQAILYSFESTPEVRIGIAFGGGNQTLPATELPLVSSWLEKLFMETLARTMVEPRRKCFPLPYVNLKKNAIGGILSVTIVSANNLFRSNIKGSSFERRTNSQGCGSVPGSGSGRISNAFVELELENLLRKTTASVGSCPAWDETFNMVLHEKMGVLKLHLYELGSSNVKYDYFASCEIKIQYVDDDSTIFWAIGRDSRALAARAEHPGKEVTMVVPFEGTESAEITVKLLVREWQFADGSRSLQGFNTLHPQQSLPGSWSTASPPTGRKLKVTVVEGRNLTGKERSGKCDPYVKVQHGKKIYRTKTVLRDVNPKWDEEFVFNEIGGGEYLKVKCCNDDFIGHENMGSARVNLEGVDAETKDVWVPLEKVGTGEIRLRIEVLNPDQDVEGCTTETGNGWIELFLIEARDLIGADLRGTSDPFVKVHYGDIKKRTKVVYKTLNPQWNQTFQFPDTGHPLILHMKDHNAVLPTSNIGHCILEYESLPPNQTVDKWIPLLGVKRGEVHVQVTKKVPEALNKTSSLQNGSNITSIYRISGKVHQIIKKVQCLTEDGNAESLSLCLEELEAAEEEQEEYMLQLQRDKTLLLAKIDELDQTLSELKSLPETEL
eukprot:TRINITY_DN5627_c0_g1_i1.p1 TRINITY_DN5627_c0_g1~~TRINITY_DN5627_c0_g1_i1.p1  ORF type:complete len:842 (-),score=186.13 TRINITY_DN5627_c0_g1_i1:179-2704(-)